MTGATAENRGATRDAGEVVFADLFSPALFCHVDVFACAEKWIPGWTPEHGLLSRGVRFSSTHGPGRFLDADELAAANRMFTLKRQMEWACGRLAAKSAARYPRTPDPVSVSVETTAKGAPFYPDFPNRCLSISHSGQIAAAAVCRRRLGMDLESLKSVDPHLLKIGFTKKERRFLENRPDRDVLSGWTQKEAVLKWMGEGFHSSLMDVEILDRQVRIKGRLMENLSLTTEILPLGQRNHPHGRAGNSAHGESGLYVVSLAVSRAA